MDKIDYYKIKQLTNCGCLCSMRESCSVCDGTLSPFKDAIKRLLDDVDPKYPEWSDDWCCCDKPVHIIADGNLHCEICFKKIGSCEVCECNYHGKSLCTATLPFKVKMKALFFNPHENCCCNGITKKYFQCALCKNGFLLTESKLIDEEYYCGGCIKSTKKIAKQLGG